jgi:hypothetical protein
MSAFEGKADSPAYRLRSETMQSGHLETVNQVDS